ncbi:hypothetical protein SAMN06265365_113140 [Tistlia consotensis]|uniref:Uncharacterized protein n=1 Tax=Tistlia consotensis USBA 355 TaxID=560819 RepID=A0A1Y6C764_9PROT|nr:hypothetical protein [Tistlia consotensis]SMF40257.1 hypothetical protein SAMN05428998_1145 [Tistlia consotensis USBA 355]SNR75167.1 hypothetical protein SAMN06265365_113140 [Tistlia consotensis]
MTDPETERRLREARASARPCAFAGCQLPRKELGQFCSTHAKRQENTGDAAGRMITTLELSPYRDLAEAFIDRNRQHPGIIAALVRIQSWINSGETPPRVTPSTPADQRTSAWFARMRREGVWPESVLAMVFGLYALQADQPATFASDRHFRHMLAYRVLRLVPGERRYSSSGQRFYARVPARVRDYLSLLIVGAFGALALKATPHLLASRKPVGPSAEPVPGTDTPFSKTPSKEPA